MRKSLTLEYDAKHTIKLANANISAIDGQPVKVPVDVKFRFFPIPTVVIESTQLPGTVLKKERFKIALDNGSQLEAMVQLFNLGTGEGSLIPARQPVDVLDTGLPLKSVHFRILNFPDLYGRQDIWGGDDHNSFRISHAKLEAPPWTIEITGMPGLTDIVRTMSQERGYAFTYNGVITRSDGTVFMPRDVEALLSALRIFLSFARGAYCSLAMVEARDQFGEQSWVRWGAHHVTPWNNKRSWLRWIHGWDTLSALFPEFWQLFAQDAEWRDTILRATDWYLQSNDSPPYVGIILTMAALERLSSQILNRARTSEKTGEFIEEALCALSIKPDLPNKCEELKQVKNWRTGSHALSDIRNDLVHSSQSLGPVSDYAYHEAWNLAQWYVELMLLRKLGFEGKYINRLTPWSERSQSIQHVPWTLDRENPIVG